MENMHIDKGQEKFSIFITWQIKITINKTNDGENKKTLIQVFVSGIARL